MKQSTNILTGLVLALFIQLLFSCGEKPATATKQAGQKAVTKTYNPVVYFEIPVNDIGRATKFYTAVFGFHFDTTIIDNNEMALFPFEEESQGISGALAKGAIYKPTTNGVLLYFHTTAITEKLKLAVASGGKILYPATDNGLGIVAEFEDTEGNRIALFQPKE